MKPRKKANTVAKAKLSPKVLKQEVSPKRGATVKKPDKTIDIDKLEKEFEGILSG